MEQSNMINQADPCPCTSGQTYADCCSAYIAGARAAPTAEALMRSRYSAFAVEAIDYLEESLLPGTRGDFDRQSVVDWSRSSKWTGLDILATEAGGPDDREGVVEFAARFQIDGDDRVHQETARFSKKDGRWYYVEGRIGKKQQTIVREGPKLGRNDPCSCGSGKKYKKCCGADA
jgi:SEC-C motif-containing protein